MLPRYLVTGEPEFGKFTTEVYSIGERFEHGFSETFAFRQNFKHWDSALARDAGAALLPAGVAAATSARGWSIALVGFVTALSIAGLLLALLLAVSARYAALVGALALAAGGVARRLLSASLCRTSVLDHARRREARSDSAF